MNKIILVFFLLFVILIISLYNYKYRNSTENFDITTPLSNEAIQNIASVYNANNLTATNVTTTGTAHFTGGGRDTWFPYTDGKNYIRGPLQIDGDVALNGGLTTNTINSTSTKVSGASSSLIVADRNPANTAWWQIYANGGKLGLWNSVGGDVFSVGSNGKVTHDSEAGWSKDEKQCKWVMARGVGDESKDSINSDNFSTTGYDNKWGMDNINHVVICPKGYYMAGWKARATSQLDEWAGGYCCKL
jgi:hypothetical protein